MGGVIVELQNIQMGILDHSPVSETMNELLKVQDIWRVRNSPIMDWIKQHHTTCYVILLLNPIKRCQVTTFSVSSTYQHILGLLTEYFETVLVLSLYQKVVSTMSGLLHKAEDALHGHHHDPNKSADHTSHHATQSNENESHGNHARELA